MIRYTRKRFEHYDICCDELDEASLKLGQLEDLEEELGVDLITLFKLFDKGAFVKEYGEPIKHTNNLQLNNYGRHGWCLGNKSWNLWLSQYGKYFALTKEELL